MSKANTSKFPRCECADPGCPVHKGRESCDKFGRQILYRIDMEDESGTSFCSKCAEDAWDSGVFTADRPNPSHPGCSDPRHTHYQGKCATDWNLHDGHWRRVFPAKNVFAVVRKSPYSGLQAWSWSLHGQAGGNYEFGRAATADAAKAAATAQVGRMGRDNPARGSTTKPRQVLRRTDLFLAAREGPAVRIFALRPGVAPKSMLISTALWRQLEPMGDREFNASLTLEVGIGVFKARGNPYPKHEQYIYRAVYQHSGKDAGLVGPAGCPSRSKEECYRIAAEHSRGRGTFIIRRYRGPLGPPAPERGNPSAEIESLSWPATTTQIRETSKKAFLAYAKREQGRIDVMCHSLYGSKPGTLADLPRQSYVLYGGTQDPGQWPVKWYASVYVTDQGVEIK